MAEPSERLHAIVSGRVQGVNFRYYTQQAAARLNLRGWVRNLADGSVETVAEGPEAGLEAFERFLRQGPPSAVVDEVRASRGVATGEFARFEVRW